MNLAFYDYIWLIFHWVLNRVSVALAAEHRTFAATKSFRWFFFKKTHHLVHHTCILFVLAIQYANYHIVVYNHHSFFLSQENQLWFFGSAHNR